MAALDELALRGEQEGEQPESRALRQRLQESELRCAQLEERIADLEAETSVLLEEPARSHQDHLVPTALVSKLVEEYDAGRALMEQKVAMAVQRQQSATRRAEAAEREVIAVQQSVAAVNATASDASARLTAERLRVEQLEGLCKELETARAEQELVVQRAVGRVEVLHAELHGKAEAMARLHSTLADRTQQCAALRADCDAMRADPLRSEIAAMSQQLQQEVSAREDMSAVWEQLLEGNARLRREKAMLENAIAETPTRPHRTSTYSDDVSPSSWQQRRHSNGVSPIHGMGMSSPSASRDASSPTLFSGAEADRGYGLSQSSPGGGGGGGSDRGLSSQYS